MITSTANQQVKNIVQLTKKAKERRRQGVFLIEGIRMFRETPAELFEKVYVAESFLQKESNVQLLHAKHTVYEIVSENVFARMSDTKTPQGILCIVRRPLYKLADLQKGKNTHLLILENIQDPGNLGTMLRTGEGAGITGVILDPDCVDLFAPKTVRATMGSIYRVPFYQADDLQTVLCSLKQQGILFYAAHSKAVKTYDAFDYCQPTAFLIGNEGNGLTKQALEQADACLRIPMAGQLESLNAAMAAGILMYEANRQRNSNYGDK